MVAPHVQGKERKSSTTLAPITDTHQCAKTPKTLQRALMNGLIKFTPAPTACCEAPANKTVLRYNQSIARVYE